MVEYLREFFFILVIDPPRGRPFGGGGVYLKGKRIGSIF